MDVREELHEALDVDDFPSRALLAQTIARLDQLPKRRSSAVPVTIAAGVIATALVVTLVAINLNPQLTAGPALPTATSIDNLVGFQFVSEQVGWVHVYAGGDVIAKTTNGGRSWHRQLTVTGLLSAATMQAVDADHAMIFGLNRDGGTVWTTGDGGSHWRSQVIAPANRNLVGGMTGYFVDPRHGWLVFQQLNCGGAEACPAQTSIGLLVYQTDDGGAHWNQVGLLSDRRVGDVSLSFVSRYVGIAVSFGGGAVAATHDGGRTWKVTEFGQAVPACPPSANCNFLFRGSANLFSESDGVFIATQVLGPPHCAASSPCSWSYPASRILYTTADGGVTWNLTRSLPARQAVVVFFDRNRALGMGPDSVESTTDGGATWSAVGSVDIPPGWYVATARFSDIRHGWVTLANSPDQAALGTRQGDDLFQMLATSDGGVTWRQVALPKI